MTFIERLHQGMILKRRFDVLVRLLASAIPQNASVLDVGCGSGTIAARIMQSRPDVTITGIDILVRGNTDIPVSEYDGVTFPSRQAALTP